MVICAPRLPERFCLMGAVALLLILRPGEAPPFPWLRWRERLVEAISAIKGDFDRILVITHIEELKDMFPVRIDVVKTAQGSQVSLH